MLPSQARSRYRGIVQIIRRICYAVMDSVITTTIHNANNVVSAYKVADHANYRYQPQILSLFLLGT